MKEIKLGSFYANEMILKIDNTDDFDYIKAWENWIGSTKRQAVEEYKDGLFLEKFVAECEIRKNQSLLEYVLSGRYFKDKLRKRLK